MTRQKLSEKSYFFGLALLAASMPVSVFIISLSQFILLGSWLLDGNIAGKIKNAFRNPVVAVLASVYFMHMLGGIYSTDYDYYFHDLKIKLPLLVLPVLIYTSPKLSQKQFEEIMGIFVLVVLASSIISMGVLYDIFPHKNPVNDIRDISVFVSHIRLSLFICIAVFTSVYFLYRYRQKYSSIKKILLILLIGWFIIFLCILEALTGIGTLIITSLLLSVYFAFKQKIISLKIITVFIAIAVPVSIFIYIKKEATRIFHGQVIEISKLDKKTINGREYKHSLDVPLQELPYLNPALKENANPLAIYVCVEELENAWNQRSKLNYNGKDLLGHEIKYTIVRFLSSKGLRKDSAGVYSLSEKEIQAIEHGIPNVEYQKKGSLKIRLDKTIMEYYSYKYGENPTGRSMMQRIEYWKAGWNIFKKNFWFGVGTGDVQKAFHKEYERVNSPLSNYARHRAHNQYLTFALTFGLFGFSFFLFSLFYPMFRLKMNIEYFYIVFFIIAVISMLTEDTLETQAGVTFFTFFNTFILFARRDSPS